MINSDSLFRKIKDESRLVQRLVDLGISNSAARNLLLPSTGGAQDARAIKGTLFDMRDPLVFWWNNLEKDRRYKGWPESLRELMRPVYPGQLHSIRKNVFSVIFLLDLTNTKHFQYLDSIFLFIERNVPLRFGFAQVAYDDACKMIT
jgi:UDP-glucose:glycoprotein glucosyltransferase